MSNPFSGANGATIPGERNYFAAGDYEVEILSTELRQGPKGSNGIVRCRVLRVIAAYPAEGPYLASNREGEIVAVVCNLDPGKDRLFHLGRFIAPIEAAVGPLGDEREAFLAKITAPPGLGLAGTKVRVTGSRSRSTGVAATPVVNLSWQPLDRAPAPAAEAPAP